MKNMFDFRKTFAEFLESFKWPRLKKTLWNYFLVFIGAVLLAFGDEVFKIPYQIVSGGVSSLGILASALWGFDANVTITVLTWGLFAIGVLILGLDFGMKTLLSTIIYPVFLFVFRNLPGLDFFNISKYVTALNGGENPILVELLAGIAGGACAGLGCGITFKGGGSTGGVDVLSLTLTKFLNIKASITSFAVDMTIIILSVLITKNITPIIIGGLTAYFCARGIDALYLGTNDTYCALIVSEKWDSINRQINDILSRGTTLTNAYGGYTGDDKVLILSVFSKSEYETIQKIVYRTDPKAFITIIKGHEVNGEGFRQIPKRLSREIERERKEHEIIAKKINVVNHPEEAKTQDVKEEKAEKQEK